MTSAEMLILFKERYNLSSNSNAGKLDDELYLLLNTAVGYFISTRFTGNNSRQASFMDDPKRVDDLRTLIKASDELSEGASLDFYSNGKSFQLPADYQFILACYSTTNNGNYSPCDLITLSEVHNFVESEYDIILLNKPKAFLSNSGNLVVLYRSNDDLNGKVTKIQYIKKPAIISATTNCDLPDHTHEEIVELAVLIATEGIENLRRYQTQSDMIDKRIE